MIEFKHNMCKHVNIWYLVYFMIISVVLIMGCINCAHATDIVTTNLNAGDASVSACNPHGNGFLDDMITGFIKESKDWIKVTSDIARRIFWLLFSFEFMWQLTVKKVFAGDIEKLWVFFFVRIILGIFFAKYIINVDLYYGIIKYISDVGVRLAGSGLDLKAQNLVDLGPSKMMGYFSCVTDSVHNATDNTGALQFITVKFTLAIMQVLLFVILSVMAFCIIMIYVQMYFVLYAGFILTGFAGSSWTLGYWEKYMHTISYIAIKFFVIAILMGVLKSTMITWNGWFNGAHGDIVLLMQASTAVLGSTIVLGLTMWELPEWAAKSLSATVNLNLHDRLVAVSRAASGGR